MTILEFFIVYVISIMIGALVINGWYVVTRGRIEVDKGGSLIETGMILRSWYFFWNKKIDAYYVRYAGSSFFDLYMDVIAPLVAYFPESKSVANFSANTVKLIGPDVPYIIERLHSKYQIEVDVDNISDGTWYKLFKKEPRYRFPSWLRKMMANCVVCFSSVYGIMLYSTLCLSAPGLFTWCEDILLMKMVYGLLYCLSLASINKLIVKNQ